MTIAPVAPSKVLLKVPVDSKARVKQFMQGLQDNICQGLEELDGKATFKQDQWERPEGGGGRSRVITDGDYFDKGGVNFSEVFGSQLPPAI
jgi:coproporphyrinogen III oxidase